jgi:superfamily II DNA or RNA helicase
MKELRMYQIDFINLIRQDLARGHKSILACSPCGSGKSIVQAEIAKMCIKKNNRILFIVHREELKEQIINTFKQCDVDLFMCEFSLIQSSRKIKNIPVVILIDECHNARAESYIKIFNKFPNAIKIGFTATPVRLGKKQLGDIFTSIVEGVSVKWLIENNFLSPYKYYCNVNLNFDEVNVVAGEYNAKKLNVIMEDEKVYNDTVDVYRKYANGKKTLIYCTSIKSADETARVFRERGFKAFSLSSKTPKKIRSLAFENFKNGTIDILTNAYLFGEGIDVPNCECVVDLAKTKSLARFIQKTMRCIRIDPLNSSKEAIIIDCVGNVFEHGLPDEERKWTLEYTAPKKVGECPYKACDQCGMISHTSAKKCVNCGYMFPVKATVVLDVSNIQEIDYQFIKSKSERIADLRTWDDLRNFQKENKYKFFWCIRQAQAKKIEIPLKYMGLLQKIQGGT